MILNKHRILDRLLVRYRIISNNLKMMNEYKIRKMIIIYLII